MKWRNNALNNNIGLNRLTQNVRKLMEEAPTLFSSKVIGKSL